MYKTLTQSNIKPTHKHILMIISPGHEEQETVARCTACDHIILVEAGETEEVNTFSYSTSGSMKN
ncbi:hypothetical protein UFOVP276_241 [uncultured Caudovirales phage]|uniref:Uncharacterized protein n=1 Tax=uncultured Caudovirales phage TaxID=2100421 RepID=A0A6J5LDT1_9CAUD|nr:hypothetical protein UFOVP127_135 [uncultured Caudovirales phage]CAB4135285.1 hypothetical protein UFOVP276_241 [uncultured Caudovirales phage]